MREDTFVKTLPFSKSKELNTLVENRRAFTLDNLELNIFETYQVSEKVPLKFQDYVFINMIRGKKVMHLNNIEAFDYMPGEMIVLPAYADMHIDFPEAKQEDPTQCTALTFSREKIDEVLTYLNEFHPRHHMVEEWNINPNIFHLYNTPELTALIDKLFQIVLSNNPLKNVLADLIFKELVIKLLQTQSLLALDISSDKNATVLQFVKEYIRKHLSEPISIDMLEIKANMSKSSLFRLFRSELGITPLEYVIRARISKAKDILRKTKNIKEACFSSGFNDVNYFTRLFKKREGMTPGMFILEN